VTAADGPRADGTAVTRPRRWLILAALVAVVLLAALLVVTIRQGPDRTIVGQVRVVEPHRLCVSDAGRKDACVIVDVPERVHGLGVGDCVRMRYSAQEILVSVQREPSGCA
jgi:hypothetical protein